MTQTGDAYDEAHNWYADDCDPRDDCDCIDYDSDWDGRAKCYRCGRSWWLTAKEMDAELRWQSEYDRQMRQQERWGWFWELYWKARSWLTRKPIPSAHRFESDDDIPF